MQGPDSFPISGVTLDEEADSCWQLAARIGASGKQRSPSDPARSFTSLLLALLYGGNVWSRWFLRYATALPVQLDEMANGLGLDPLQLKTIRDAKEASSVSPSPEGWTSSANNIVNGAAQLHRLCSGSNVPLGVRHLLGAYFYRLPSDHDAQMKGWGFELPREASALLRQVKQRLPDEEKAWVDLHLGTFKEPPSLDAGDPMPPPRISGFAADSPEGDDQLDIEDDVYALSALLCSTRITPPLSVGLFGDWGSGKSFFIRQLQKGAAWISAQARSSKQLQRDLPFYKNVVQIEFNAWNYSAGNLWAALVQHILENLRLSKDEPNNLVEARRKHLQQTMELERKVRDAAEHKRDEAQRKLAQAQTELKKSRDLHEEKVKQLAQMRAEDVLRTVELDDSTKRQINTLVTSLGLQQVSGGITDFVSALESSRALLTRGSALWSKLPSDSKRSFLVGAALVLIGPPLAAVVVAALVQLISPNAASIASVASWLSATLVFGAQWLRQRNAELSEQIGKIEALHALARRRVEDAQQAFRAQVAALEQQINLARDDVSTAQAQQQEAAERLEQLEQALLATTPASVLADFVRERSESDDYRKYLGLPAVIRRDFESISNMIAQENLALTKVDTLQGEELNANQRINRIVLYIDDLDRCSEELVVEVLKAVHLLLAFPLFVVVVAVDARWVSRALSKRFPGLLTGAADTPGGEALGESDHATTDDYLEKIFQIPFWLRPPSDAAARKMVRSLVPEGASAPSVPGTNVHSSPSTGGDKTQAAPAFKQHRHNPQAMALDITPEEIAYIDTLVPLLEHSPRALKRFINIYRLLKASLPPEEESSFLELQSEGAGSPGPFDKPYKSVLWLLAVSNGMHRLSDGLLTAFLDIPAKPEARTSAQSNLGEVINALRNDSRTPSDEIERVEKWLESNAASGWKTTDPYALQPWVPRVSRYSYQLFRGIRA